MCPQKNTESVFKKFYKPRFYGVFSRCFRMTIKHIPTELVSLVHHIKLNESGWWKKAITQRIKYILWSSDSILTSDELRAILKAEHHVDINQADLNDTISILRSRNELKDLQNKQLVLSEECRALMNKESEQDKNEQAMCKEVFKNSIKAHCSNLNGDEVWDNFIKSIIHAIKKIGANTFRLLNDKNLRKESDWLEPFLTKYENNRQGLNKTITSFFSPKNTACRSQILKIMSMHFFAEASNLSKETINQLEKSKKPSTIKVLLDTNFIFSLLNLHENPANEAALSLLELSKNLHILKLKLYVLPSTIDEAQRTIAAHVEKISKIRVNKAIYSIAKTIPTSGIAEKFFKEAYNNPELSAVDYYAPYISDLKIILKEKGIEVFDAPPAVWNINQNVIDDITIELEEEKKFKEEKQKGYETLLHDIVFWHVIESRRQKPETSPIDTEIWGVSIDWRLIGFDQKKRRSTGSTVPAVIYPTNFVQLLQFWIPRSENLDATLIESLQIPLFFQKFDEEDEATTIKILNALSRFENHQDFGTETASNILKNTALRKKIKDEDASISGTIDLIKEELIKENEKNFIENESLKTKITEISDKSTQERLAHETAIIKEKENTFRVLDDQLNLIIKDSDQRFFYKKIITAAAVFFCYLLMVFLAFHFTWDKFEIFAWALSLLPPLGTGIYFLLFDGYINLKETMNKIKLNNQIKLIKKRGFNDQLYKELKMELEADQARRLGSHVQHYKPQH